MAASSSPQRHETKWDPGEDRELETEVGWLRVGSECWVVIRGSQEPIPERLAPFIARGLLREMLHHGHPMRTEVVRLDDRE